MGKNKITFVMGGVIIYVIICLGFLFFKFNFSVIKDILPGGLDYTVSSIDDLDEIEGWLVKNEFGIVMESLNIDPKIFMQIDRQKDSLYVDIVVNKLEHNGNPVQSTNAEVYYSSDNYFTATQKVVFDLKVGHNVINVPAERIYTFLRIDLTDKKGLTVNLDEINVTDYFKINLYSAIMVILFARNSEYTIETKIRELFNCLMDFFKSFYNYILNNKIVAIMTFMFVLLSYGVLCSYYTIYIDEERQIIETYAEMGWVAQGRFGNYLFERFLLTGTIYTSWLGDAIAAVLLGFSALINVFNYNELSEKKIHKFGQIVYCGISISVPYVCGAYMVVGIYNIEISLGLCLIAIASYFILVNKGRKVTRYVWAVFCIFIGVSIYQAFVSVFATGIVLCFLFKVLFDKEKIILKGLIDQIFQSILICVISVIIYYLINKGFIMYMGSTSDYLSNSFVGWGKGYNFAEVLSNIFMNIKLVLIGSKQILYGGIIYKVSFMAYGIFIIVQLFSAKFILPIM